VVVRRGSVVASCHFLFRQQPALSQIVNQPTPTDVAHAAYASCRSGFGCRGNLNWDREGDNFRRSVLIV